MVSRSDTAATSRPINGTVDGAFSGGARATDILPINGARIAALAHASTTSRATPTGGRHRPSRRVRRRIGVRPPFSYGKKAVQRPDSPSALFE